MAKTCWKCNQNIGFGKKNFRKKDFDDNKVSYPDNLGKDDHLCENCFLETLVIQEPKEAKGVQNIFKIIKKKYGDDKAYVKYQARFDELEIIERNLQRLEGFRCWLCEGTGIWPHVFNENKNCEFVPLNGKTAICNSCTTKLNKGQRFEKIFAENKEKNKKSIDKIEQKKLKILSKHGATRLKLPLLEENNSGFEKLSSDWKQKIGETILKSDKNNALYYGGHKRYTSGGYYSNEVSGTLELTDKHLIFNEKNNKFEIKIPLISIIIEDWNVKTSSRRQTTSGSIGFGFGNIHESGKKHTLVIPYTDENGIRQEPQFGFGAAPGFNPAEKWAKVLYDSLIEIKKETKDMMNEKTSDNDDKSSENTEDPIKVLKLRLAKGEINKKEFEELKETLSSE